MGNYLKKILNTVSILFWCHHQEKDLWSHQCVYFPQRHHDLPISDTFGNFCLNVFPPCPTLLQTQTIFLYSSVCPGFLFQLKAPSWAFKALCIYLVSVSHFVNMLTCVIIAPPQLCWMPCRAENCLLVCSLSCPQAINNADSTC